MKLHFGSKDAIGACSHPFTSDVRAASRRQYLSRVCGSKYNSFTSTWAVCSQTCVRALSQNDSSYSMELLATAQLSVLSEQRQHSRLLLQRHQQQPVGMQQQQQQQQQLELTELDSRSTSLQQQHQIHEEVAAAQLPHAQHLDHDQQCLAQEQQQQQQQQSGVAWLRLQSFAATLLLAALAALTHPSRAAAAAPLTSSGRSQWPVVTNDSLSSSSSSSRYAAGLEVHNSSTSSRNMVAATPSPLFSNPATGFGDNSSGGSSTGSSSNAAPAASSAAAAATAGSGIDDLLGYERSTVALYEAACPSVVNITHLRAMQNFYTLDIHRCELHTEAATPLALQVLSGDVICELCSGGASGCQNHQHQQQQQQQQQKHFKLLI